MTDNNNGDSNNNEGNDNAIMCVCYWCLLKASVPDMTYNVFGGTLNTISLLKVDLFCVDRVAL